MSETDEVQSKVEKQEAVVKEVAELEFDRFVDLMGIDLDPSTMDDEDKKGLVLQKSRIIKAIQRGSLVVNEKGEPVYTPQRKSGADSITFHCPTGAALMEMDKKQLNHDITKSITVLASISKTNQAVFSNMELPDLNVCTAILTVFLG